MSAKLPHEATRNGPKSNKVPLFWCMASGCPIPKDRDGTRHWVTEAHFKNGCCKKTKEGYFGPSHHRLQDGR